jgi:hypothetical protein
MTYHLSLQLPNHSFAMSSRNLTQSSHPFCPYYAQLVLASVTTRVGHFLLTCSISIASSSCGVRLVTSLDAAFSTQHMPIHMSMSPSLNQVQPENMCRVSLVHRLNVLFSCSAVSLATSSFMKNSTSNTLTRS